MIFYNEVPPRASTCWESLFNSPCIYFFRDPDAIEPATEATPATVSVPTNSWWSPWLDVAKSKVLLQVCMKLPMAVDDAKVTKLGKLSKRQFFGTSILPTHLSLVSVYRGVWVCEEGPEWNNFCCQIRSERRCEFYCSCPQRHSQGRL